MTNKPARNRAYLGWIRSLPCLVCRTTRNVEASHVGPHGLAQKASDFMTVPLCLRHHRTGNDSLHKLGRRHFEERHGVDLLGQAERLAQRMQVRIENGMFVGYLQDESIVLSPVQKGLACMVRLAVSATRERVSTVSVSRQSEVLARRNDASSGGSIRS